MVERLWSNAAQAKQKVPFFHFVLSRSDCAPPSTHIIYTHYLISWPAATQHMSHSQCVLILIYDIKRTDWIVKVQLICSVSHMHRFPLDVLKLRETERETRTTLNQKQRPGIEPSLSISIQTHRWYFPILFFFFIKAFYLSKSKLRDSAALFCSFTHVIHPGYKCKLFHYF